MSIHKKQIEDLNPWKAFLSYHVLYLHSQYVLLLCNISHCPNLKICDEPFMSKIPCTIYNLFSFATYFLLLVRDGEIICFFMNPCIFFLMHDADFLKRLCAILELYKKLPLPSLSVLDSMIKCKMLTNQLLVYG